VVRFAALKVFLTPAFSLGSLRLRPPELIEALPLTLEVVQAMDQVPKAQVLDMPVRIVAADAVAHDMPHVRADSDIRDPASRKALVPVSR